MPSKPWPLRAALTSAACDALLARARPNPVLGLQVENVGGYRPHCDFQSAETPLSVGQTLEPGGKRVAFARDLSVVYAMVEAASERLALANGQIAFGSAQ